MKTAGVAQLGEQQTEARNGILEVPCSIHGPGIFATKYSFVNVFDRSYQMLFQYLLVV